MGIITDSGRAAVAEAISLRPLFLAWGTGESNWETNRPAEDELKTALVNEVGRKALFRSLFVYPDDEGELVVSEESRYAISATPTKYLYVEFEFDFRDGAGESIREIGVFMGGKLKTGLPPGQSYFTPDQIVDPGTLLMLEHREKTLERTTSERCSLGYVIPF